MIFATVRLLLASLLAAWVQASPLLTTRQGAVVVLPASQVASFKPYTFYASAAACEPARTLAWNCGGKAFFFLLLGCLNNMTFAANCNANPSFIPIASGGNGASVQYWYVGWDPQLRTLIVGHQGTDASKMQVNFHGHLTCGLTYYSLPILTDANIILSSLDSGLFPGISSNVRVHSGFEESQAEFVRLLSCNCPMADTWNFSTATQVLAAVQQGIQRFGANRVTVVGHSLGKFDPSSFITSRTLTSRTTHRRRDCSSGCCLSSPPSAEQRDRVIHWVWKP